MSVTHRYRRFVGGGAWRCGSRPTTNAFAIEAGGLSVSVTRSEVDDQHRSDSWVATDPL